MKQLAMKQLSDDSLNFITSAVNDKHAVYLAGKKNIPTNSIVIKNKDIYGLLKYRFIYDIDGIRLQIPENENHLNIKRLIDMLMDEI